MPSWAKVSWDNTKCRSLSQNKFCIDWHTLKSTRNSIEVLFNFRVKIKLNNYFQMWDRTAGRIYNFVLNCSLFNEYFNCKTINLHDLISNLNLDSTCTKTISRIYFRCYGFVYTEFFCWFRVLPTLNDSCFVEGTYYFKITQQEQSVGNCCFSETFL